MSVFSPIRLVLTDVDGVLTAGELIFAPGQDGEAKPFNVKDGVAFGMLRRVGHKTGIVTGRASDAVRRRAAELKVDCLVEGCSDKLAALADLLARFDLPADAVAYIGDDVQDLPLLAAVGLSAAPADADPRVRRRALLVTRAAGGRGAFRELVERLLTAQGRLAAALAPYESTAGEKR